MPQVLQCLQDVQVHRRRAHGEDVAFLCRHPLPADATVRQHLCRSVALLQASPMLQGHVRMRQFVNAYLATGLEQSPQVRAATNEIALIALPPYIAD